jgi:hypothetical protein
MKKGFCVAVFVLMFTSFLGGQVFAVDGVVLIDQNRALAGNVTPGDTPGFPVSITLPGSYRLSGNLTAPAGSNGIEISADDVTIDLNGFRMAGGGPSTAIDDTGSHQRLEIRGGTISGFGDGISMLTSNHVIVRDVRSTNLSSLSIVVGKYATIQRNSVQGLIQATCPSVLTENVTEGFLTIFVDEPGKNCVRWNNRSIGFTDPVNQ